MSKTIILPLSDVTPQYAAVPFAIIAYWIRNEDPAFIDIYLNDGEHLRTYDSPPISLDDIETKLKQYFERPTTYTIPTIMRGTDQGLTTLPLDQICAVTYGIRGPTELRIWLNSGQQFHFANGTQQIFDELHTLLEERSS